MKTLLLLLTAAAGLAGCAVYPGPGYEQPYYGSVGAPAYPAYPYAVEPPVYIQGGVYRSYDAPRYYPAPVRVVPQHRPPSVVHGVPRPGWGNGDRDHDGIPNRFDRDRNNDGVPDRAQRNRIIGDRDGDGVPDVAERRRENVEVPNLMDRRISGPGRK